MSDDEGAVVDVALNAQQLELLDHLCAEHGFPSRSDALRHGLAAYLAAVAPGGGR